MSFDAIAMAAIAQKEGEIGPDSGSISLLIWNDSKLSLCAISTKEIASKALCIAFPSTGFLSEGGLGGTLSFF